MEEFRCVRHQAVYSSQGWGIQVGGQEEEIEEKNKKIINLNKNQSVCITESFIKEQAGIYFHCFYNKAMNLLCSNINPMIPVFALQMLVKAPFHRADCRTGDILPPRPQRPMRGLCHL